MDRRISGWTVAALGMISFFLIWLITMWDCFPMFLDLYYHASCMVGFDQAGGLALHDFWGYAPVGRPHLYPPLLPILMLAFYKIGISALSVTRIFSVTIFPCVLISIWWVCRQFYGERKAFFILAAATLPYTFFLTSVNAIPASLAVIILMFLFYAVEKKRILAGTLLLGMSFYVHGGLPWITILALALYSALNRDKIKIVLIIILGGILLGSPWLIHLLRNKDYFTVIRARENRYFEGNPVLYIFTVFGILQALKNKRKYCFPLALLAAMLPMLINYRYRFLCGQGLLPVVMLAGIGIEKCYVGADRFLKEHLNRSAYRLALPIVILYLLTFFSPTIFWDTEKISFAARGSTLVNLIPGYKQGLRANEATLYSKKFAGEVVEAIKENTEPDDIIYCNYPYVGGMFYALSGRVTSSGMLREIKPTYRVNPILSASLIIWIKHPEGIFDPKLKSLIKSLRLKEVKDAAIAHIYRNPFPVAKRKIVRALIPSALLFIIIFAWMAVLTWSFIKK